MGRLIGIINKTMTNTWKIKNLAIAALVAAPMLTACSSDDPSGLGELEQEEQALVRLLAILLQMSGSLADSLELLRRPAILPQHLL